MSEFEEILLPSYLYRTQVTRVGANQAWHSDLRMLEDKVFQVARPLQSEPLIASFRYSRKAAMLAFAHCRVLHAIVDIAIELGTFRSFHDELNDLEAVSFVHCPVVTSHAEVLEDELWTFFEQCLIKSLEVELI